MEAVMQLVAHNPEPDITSGDAGRVALTFFFNLMEHWGCTKDQQCTLLALGGQAGRARQLCAVSCGS